MATGTEDALPSKPANPWEKKIHPWSSPVQDTQPLTEVMSEQLASQLQEDDDLKTVEVTASEVPWDCNLELDTSSDRLLAEALQLEYDKEHDDALKIWESSYNKDSKVSLSFSNYRKTHPMLTEDSSDSDEFDDDIDYGPHDKVQLGPVTGKKSGISGRGKNIVTKHDIDVSTRKNATKMMQFPPHFHSGDSISGDLKLSNQVYNVLKEHSISEEKKQSRHHDKKEKSTAEMAIDPKTRLQLYKLINNEILEAVNGTISTGKEAIILHAQGGKFTESDQLVPSECALKVYKTTLNEFRTRDKYIKDDYRFRDRFKKLNPRKFVRLWAEKEMHNLMRMRKAGINCPEVVLLKKHILVMSFIGTNQKRAPKLKEAVLSADQYNQAYVQCVQMMTKLYKEARLVHADLSEYNVLWHQGQAWFIDVSQSIDPSHPNGLEFLFKDCTHISNFFTKVGVPDVLKPQQLFNEITGLNIEYASDGDFLASLRQFERERKLEDKAHVKTLEDYPFEYFFEKTKQKVTELATNERKGDESE